MWMVLIPSLLLIEKLFTYLKIWYFLVQAKQQQLILQSRCPSDHVPRSPPGSYADLQYLYSNYTIVFSSTSYTSTLRTTFPFPIYISTHHHVQLEFTKHLVLRWL